jgi:hypothetical protein
MVKYPKDPFIRNSFFYLKRNFRRIVKKNEILKKEKILDQIKAMERNNPGAFWNLINSIKEKKKHAADIDVDIFQEYFKKLHKGIVNEHLDSEFKTKLENRIKNIKPSEWVEELDKGIKLEEIKQAAKP